MALTYYLIIPVAMVIIILAVFALGARGRGKPIKCPECDAVFKKPAFVEKKGGIGFSLPGIGDYTCPKCGYRGNTSNFVSAEESGT
ncbi:MAG: hypothetical protein ACYCQJ_07800 [Nitrososphaerales archaeon]